MPAGVVRTGAVDARERRAGSAAALPHVDPRREARCGRVAAGHGPDPPRLFRRHRVEVRPAAVDAARFGAAHGGGIPRRERGAGGVAREAGPHRSK
jgi:hypothetical protein